MGQEGDKKPHHLYDDHQILKRPYIKERRYALAVKKDKRRPEAVP